MIRTKNQKIAILARAKFSIKIFRFWKSIPKAVKKYLKQKEYIFIKVSVKSFLEQATISLWNSEDKEFAYKSKIHTNIIRKRKKKIGIWKNYFAVFISTMIII